MKIKKINPFRLWYYVRQGYATYLVFIVAVTNLMVTSYYLAIKDIPILHNIFPSFAWFALFMVGVGLPLSLSLGYWHYKKSKAQHHQLEIEVEASPLTPIFLQTYIMLQRLLMGEKLTEEDQHRMKIINDEVEKYFKRIRTSDDYTIK
ncbi:MAG: hypothetical protein KGL95_11485 [Patescibacteria group bacterium]|nr:hypothetical protein [Patescibacteria group bacterium]